jgi:HSP20 family protein
MSSLMVERIRDTEQTNAPIFRELQKVLDETQRRAFSLFQERGATPGADLDDWLRAEREIVWSPQAELVESDKEVRIQIAAPGLEPGQIHVTALPETIIVKGDATHQHKRGDGSVQFCEFSEKSLFRRFELDNRIDVERVTATLDNGILRIVAPKPTPAPGRHVPVSRS